MKIIKGNLNKDVIKSPEKRGWFIGHFIDKDSVFNNNDFEIRWAIHKKGDKKDIPGYNKTAKTISILIKGEMKIDFPDNKRSIILKKVGDYAFWDSKILHTSEMSRTIH